MINISRRHSALAIALLVIGLMGHVIAASILGYSIAYVHHVAGFFIIAAITAPLALLGGRFLWRGRHHVTVLFFAAIQAALGLMVLYGEYRKYYG